MSQNPIRIGVLGCGRYSRSVVDKLDQTSRYRIVACLDTEHTAAQALATCTSAAPYSDIDAFLAHPEMEAVSINTPVALHGQHARCCLEADKHVFITKPITAFVPEARAVLEMAQQRSLALVVGHHARYAPALRLIETCLGEGKIGRLCNIQICSCSSAGLEQEPGDWRIEPGRNPGGPLLQCGIHTIEFLIGCLGPVKTIFATCQADITSFDVIDNALTIMEFENGVQVSFVCNYTTAYLHTMHFCGTTGNLHLHQHITNIGAAQVYFQPRMRGQHEPWQELAIPTDPNRADGPSRLETMFAQQVRSGSKCYRNALDAIDALRVVHAAVKSIEIRQPVDMSTFL